ncbi:hypothetical protein ACFP2T_47690 [Plantactinospora solaniradicis]|uniref:Uncharacterized protein n=1 Tax=Plantactinospora solaniradicis TaxID=1723736 RepID=A0ABW1KTB6_9ACTN
MWELLGMLIEGAIDLAGDLFEEGGEVAAAPVPAEPAAQLTPLGDGLYASGSMVAPIDGGISPDRFDPKPPFGAFAP